MTEVKDIKEKEKWLSVCHKAKVVPLYKASDFLDNYTNVDYACAECGHICELIDPEKEVKQ